MLETRNIGVEIGFQGNIYDLEENTAKQLIKINVAKEFKEEIVVPVEIAPREEVIKQTINKRVKK